MKKTFSLLLTVAMLLAMIPTLAIGASAEPVTATPLNITHVSGTVNHADNNESNAPLDWSKIWGTSNNSIRFGYFFDESVEIVGKFDKPTKIGSVTLNSVYWHSRLNNIEVLFSVDGVNWVSAFFMHNMGGSSSYKLFNIPVPAHIADTEFSYIKLFKNHDTYLEFDGDKDGTNESTYFDLRYVAVYPATESDDNVNAKCISNVADNTNRNTNADRNNAWNMITPSTNLLVGSGVAKGTELFRAELESPTILDGIYVRVSSNAARLNSTNFEASVDGETWTNVATLGGANTYANKSVWLESTDKTTAYKYIRIIKNNTWTWEAIGFGIYGTETGADFVGTQVKKDASSWALRLVSTVDATNLTKVGYEITAMADGMTDKIWDKSTEIVYNSIYETTTEGTNKLTALDLGGAYIFTATIHGISIEDYDEITFFVKPYVIDANGNKIYSLEQTLVYNDGVLQ